MSLCPWENSTWLVSVSISACSDIGLGVLFQPGSSVRSVLLNMLGRKLFFFSFSGDFKWLHDRGPVEYALLLSLLSSGMVDAFRNELLPGLTVQATLLLLLLR